MLLSYSTLLTRFFVTVLLQGALGNEVYMTGEPSVEVVKVRRPNFYPDPGIRTVSKEQNRNYVPWSHLRRKPQHPPLWRIEGERCYKGYCMGLVRSTNDYKKTYKSYIRHEEDDIRALLKEAGYPIDSGAVASEGNADSPASQIKSSGTNKESNNYGRDNDHTYKVESKSVHTKGTETVTNHKDNNQGGSDPNNVISESQYSETVDVSKTKEGESTDNSKGNRGDSEMNTTSNAYLTQGKTNEEHLQSVDSESVELTKTVTKVNDKNEKGSGINAEAESQFSEQEDDSKTEEIESADNNNGNEEQDNANKEESQSEESETVYATKTETKYEDKNEEGSDMNAEAEHQLYEHEDYSNTKNVESADNNNGNANKEESQSEESETVYATKTETKYEDKNEEGSDKNAEAEHQLYEHEDNSNTENVESADNNNGNAEQDNANKKESQSEQSETVYATKTETKYEDKLEKGSYMNAEAEHQLNEHEEKSGTKEVEVVVSTDKETYTETKKEESTSHDVEEKDATLVKKIKSKDEESKYEEKFDTYVQSDN